MLKKIFFIVLCTFTFSAYFSTTVAMKQHTTERSLEEKIYAYIQSDLGNEKDLITLIDDINVGLNLLYSLYKGITYEELGYCSVSNDNNQNRYKWLKSIRRKLESSSVQLADETNARLSIEQNRDRADSSKINSLTLKLGAATYIMTIVKRSNKVMTLSEISTMIRLVYQGITVELLKIGEHARVVKDLKLIDENIKHTRAWDYRNDYNAFSICRKCANCKKPASKENEHKVCAACNVTRYCSRQCQRNHWQIHRVKCKKLRKKSKKQ